MSINNIHDKFYTNDDVALQCWEDTVELLSLSPSDNPPIVEPSAGGGAFLRAFQNTGFTAWEAYDIAPEAQGIEQQDFLALERKYDGAITVGNPPFGHRSHLAIDFINHAANFSDAICFVLPITFLKWSTHKQISPNWKLIYSKRLAANSFNENGEEYSIRCVYQIWIRRDSRFDDAQTDLRLLSSPPIAKQDDFIIWQHNATDESRKYVDEDWEIAVYRQGYKDYSKRFYKTNDYNEIRDLVYNTNLQFFFIKPLHDKAREIINRIDFEELALSNLSTPGFGKRDFVQAYDAAAQEMLEAET